MTAQGQELPLIRLNPCPKGYTKDSDKAISPADTVQKVLGRLEELGSDILRETRRVDVGRLGIPVYLSVCGADARRILPTRKGLCAHGAHGALRLLLFLGARAVFCEGDL